METSKLFGNDELASLKEALPSHYYAKFESLWANKNEEKCPTRQNVYAVLIGKSENDKVLEILLDIVEERKVLKRRIKSVTSHAEEQEA